MKESAADRKRTHGMSRHPAYRNWLHAKTRCEDRACEFFKDYGGRGIRVCERWASFDAFWEDMGPTWLEGLTLDREDVNGNYEPSNCRWATSKQQANNRRDNVIIDTPKGRMNLTQASETFGISQKTIFSRYHAGWPIEHLLTPPRYNARWHTKP
jgi:hypothetical protein